VKLARRWRAENESTGPCRFRVLIQSKQPTHQQTASTLAEVKATMESAAKAAQEEAKRKAEERKKAAQKPPDKRSDAMAAVWSHAGQDRGATLARGVGERPTGSGFRDERGRGAEKCRRQGSKDGHFRSLGFSGEARMAASVARGSTSHWKPD
jgi:hypothetical protein